MHTTNRSITSVRDRSSPRWRSPLRTCGGRGPRRPPTDDVREPERRHARARRRGAKTTRRGCSRSSGPAPRTSSPRAIRSPTAQRARALRRPVPRERPTFETLPVGPVIAHLGKDDWPFPIPLVKDGDGWRFDTAAGTRRAAEPPHRPERAAGDRRLPRLRRRAARVREGRRTGRRLAHLRAEGAERAREARRSLLGGSDGKHPSPLGPLLAEADGRGLHEADGGRRARPYHGYFYRILTAQGANAPGGARAT